MGAVDDATGKILGLVFRPQEDLWGYLKLMHDVISRHGVPQTLYTDRHAIFFSSRRDKPILEDENLCGCYRTRRLQESPQL